MFIYAYNVVNFSLNMIVFHVHNQNTTTKANSMFPFSFIVVILLLYNILLPVSICVVSYRPSMLAPTLFVFRNRIHNS